MPKLNTSGFLFRFRSNWLIHHNPKIQHFCVLFYFTIYQIWWCLFFHLFPDYSSKEFSQGRKPSPENWIGRERKSQGTSFQSLKKHLTDMSSEMKARMEGLTRGKGSSQEDRENQEINLEYFARNLFSNCPEAREIILDRLDLETELTCRLV